MRWPILRALLHKELLRHLANRGTLALLLLVLLAGLLLALLGPDGPAPGIRICYVDYHPDGPLVEHLRRHIPAELADRIRFRRLGDVPTDARGTLLYPAGSGAIQLRPGPPAHGVPPGAGSYAVWVWHPGTAADMAPYETWFWEESLRFLQGRAASAAPLFPAPALRSSLGAFEPRAGLRVGLVLFAVFFVCVYLLAGLTCEERERGVLLAQALSGASTTELLAARLLFYPALALVLAALLAAVGQPAALARPFFWLALLVAAGGAAGIGLTLASLARTQRSAGTAALCYLLGVTGLLLLCQRAGLSALPHLALEYHAPRLLHAALAGTVAPGHWAHLGSAAALACAWTTLAGLLFRRLGWQ
jgi:hypothetical protein